ncbi:MAG TPA: hypothetical protein VK911_17895 [Vicinamibacterales bacterium]|nr:hypothetical protein [Vicinamibacterales bacterium]
MVKVAGSANTCVTRVSAHSRSSRPPTSKKRVLTSNEVAPIVAISTSASYRPPGRIGPVKLASACRIGTRNSSERNQSSQRATSAGTTKSSNTRCATGRIRPKKRIPRGSASSKCTVIG